MFRTVPSFLGLSLICAAGALACPAAAKATAIPYALTATNGFTSAARATDLGLIPDAMPMHVTLGLNPPNRAAIAMLIRRQNTPGDAMYHRYLTPQESARLFSPSGALVASVAGYLTRNGFTNVHVTPDNLLVTADGSVRTSRSAFGVHEHVMSARGQRFYANAETPHLPAAFGANVASVLGLNSYSSHTMLRHAALRRTAATNANCTAVPTTSLCVLNEYGPAQFQQAYDAVGSPNGSKTTIAIFAEGALGQVVTDLRTQEAASGLPKVPYAVIPTGIASTDTSGADEWDLDTQYSTGIAQYVNKLLIYDAPSLTDADTSIEFDRFKTDDVAKAGSASFGECEVFPDTDGALLTDDIIFSLAAAQGQTIFSSAGDTGAFCPAPVAGMNGVPAGLPFQEYPASSTYVVAVGGTTLVTTPAGAYTGEIAWYSGGGGPSLLESPGYWQSGVVNTAISTVAARAMPDIAMDADPDTGASVIVAGVAEEVGGTSLSSPLALGAWARIESAHGDKLGFAAPLLYKEFADDVTSADSAPLAGTLTQPIGGFHDVFLGLNPLPATPEYDFTTGLGTLDIAKQDADITN